MLFYQHTVLEHHQINTRLLFDIEELSFLLLEYQLCHNSNCCILCSSEDIFFHSLSSLKRNKASQGTPPENTLVSSSDAAKGEVDYAEIDRCLCSEQTEENSRAYDDLSTLHQNVSEQKFR